MPNYISQAACRGVRPRKIALRRRVSRPHLVARLIRERQVVRFLKAPDAFGKTSLAGEYAEVAFSFEHVFWFDCTSPCFVRDLDEGDFAAGVLACDSEASLAVFDDLPRLDSERVEEFSAIMDALLSAGCEVLVTMQPSCDAYGALQPDRVVVSADDLLLNDEELRTIPGAEELGGQPFCLIPGIAWDAEAGRERLIAGIVREELPVDAAFLLYYALLMQEGTFVDCADCLSHRVRPTELLADYPYVVWEPDSERFRAIEVDASMVTRVFSQLIPQFSELMGFSDKATLHRFFADTLMRDGCEGRACDIIRATGDRRMGEAWLAENCGILFRRCCFAESLRLYRFLFQRAAPRSARIRMFYAWLLAVIGFSEDAVLAAHMIAVSANTPLELRIIAYLLLLDHGDASVREQAASGLVALADSLRDQGEGAFENAPWYEVLVRRLVNEHSSVWGPLATVCSCLEAHRDELDDVIAFWDSEEADDETYLLALSKAISAYPDQAPASWIAQFLSRLSALYARGRFGYAFATSLECYERLLQRDPALPALPAQHLVPMNEIKAYSYREIYRAREVMNEGGAIGQAPSRGAVHASSQMLDDSSAARVPLLEATLFGSVTASIGGQRVSEDWFRRQKVKTLFAILVLNAGREVPRDRLVEALWPDSPIDTARKNFYTLWSILHRALRLADGTCPYLIRMQGGYKLDDRCLASDVARVEEICRAFMAGPLDEQLWIQMFSELRAACSGELMPSEVQNDYIVRKRTEFRMRIVDALVTGSTRLADEGHAQPALWFAQTALQHDAAREDTYTVLMAAQMANGQRTAAMETYFACRRFLAEELGIDPSPRTVALYRELIEEETDLDF